MEIVNGGLLLILVMPLKDLEIGSPYDLLITFPRYVVEDHLHQLNPRFWQELISYKYYV